MNKFWILDVEFWIDFQLFIKNKALKIQN